MMNNEDPNGEKHLKLSSGMGFSDIYNKMGGFLFYTSSCVRSSIDMKVR
jgi:hypothetical protein